LPICKDVAEEQIFTSCFQRDSLKDELVIYLFLIVATGLLFWAGVKPWVDKARERAGFGRATGAGRDDSAHVPVGREGEQEGLADGT
jgi:hypothetical protein